MLLLMSSEPKHAYYDGTSATVDKVLYDDKEYWGVKLFACREQSALMMNQIGLHSDPGEAHLLGVGQWTRHPYKMGIKEDRYREVFRKVTPFVAAVDKALTTQPGKDDTLGGCCLEIQRMANNLYDGNMRDLVPNRMRLEWKLDGELASQAINVNRFMRGHLWNIPFWCMKYIPMMSFLMHIPRLTSSLLVSPYINLRRHAWKYQNGVLGRGVTRSPWYTIFRAFYRKLGYAFSVTRYDGGFWTMFINLLYSMTEEDYLYNLLETTDRCNGYNTFFSREEVREKMNANVAKVAYHLRKYGFSNFCYPIAGMA